MEYALNFKVLAFERLPAALLQRTELSYAAR